MIRALVVDDEPLALDVLTTLLREHGDVQVVGQADSGEAAIQAILLLRPDVVFLDVQMPGPDGLEVVRRIADRYLPVIVFVTAFDHFAVQAFELHALDYLLKPASAERFRVAMERVRRELARDERLGPASIGRLLDAKSGEASTRLRRFVVRERGDYILVPVEQVERIEAAGNYAELHCFTAKAPGAETVHLVRETMSRLAQLLDPESFVRIHRSRIIQRSRVDAVQANGSGDFDVRLRSGAVVEMSRTHKGGLLSQE